jgi:hypothetical protein
MSIEELDIDEHFDIKLLTAVENDIILHIGRAKVPTELIRKLIDVIKEGSRLYYVDEQANGSADDKPGDMTSMNRSSDLLATVGTIVPVMKETFAYAALRCLFSLCSNEKQGKPLVFQFIQRTRFYFNIVFFFFFPKTKQKCDSALQKLLLPCC